MNKKSMLTSLLLLSTVLLHAQHNLPQSRIWAMGNKVGLDFSNLSSPTPITTNLQNTNEAAASICDTGGRLLFYTNGTVIWNASGGQMPNGASLIGTTGSTRSTTQGAAIVSVPDSAGKYYVFSLTEGSNCRLYCNKINMSLDNGNGDVDVSFPLRGTILNDSGLTEKMSVVAGCNNSVWVVVHVQNSRSFRAYQVTAAGVSLTPVVSSVGNFPGGHYQQGVIKFAAERGKMLNCNFRATATTNAGVEVFDFDNVTGIISNAVLLDSSSHYGGAFSPDGTKVYAGSTVVLNTGTISQWDLTATNPKASKTVLGPCGQYTDFKLGPDGKVYFGALAGSSGYSNYRFMGRVNFPNLAGTSCGYKDSVSSLVFPHATSATIGALTQGMPNDVAVPVPGAFFTRRSLDTTVCKAFSSFILNAPAGYTSRSWDNGDTGSTRNIAVRGIYTLRSVTPCATRIDTFIVSGADMPAIAISRNGDVLSASIGFQSYQWFRNDTAIPGANASSYTISSNGRFTVRGNFGSGCSDTLSIRVENITGIGGGPLAAKVRCYPNPANDRLHIDAPAGTAAVIFSLDGRAVLRSAGSNILAVNELPSGTYMLRVTDTSGMRIAADQLIRIMH